METPEPDFHLLSNISVNGKFQPDPKVLTRIAKSFYEKDSLKISYLHFISRTTWPYLKKYLIWLQNNNYVLYNKNDESYHLTETGWKTFGLIMHLHEQADLKKKHTDFNLMD